MKNLYSMLMLLITTFVMVGCSDDTENPYVMESQVQVLKANVLFGAKGGEGSVEVSAPGAITATLNSSWAVATVEGKTVKVVAQPNENANGRSTRLTIKSGKDSTQLTVQQTGLVFSLQTDPSIVVGDQAGEKQYSLEHSNTLDISTTADWLTASYDDDKFTVKYTQNTTGRVRTARINYSSGNVSNSIVVTQGTLADIIDKSYLLVGTFEANGQQRGIEFPASFVQESGKLFLHVSSTSAGFDWKIPVTFDEANLKLSLKSADNVGTFTGDIKGDGTSMTANVFLLMYSTKGGGKSIVSDDSGIFSGSFFAAKTGEMNCNLDGNEANGYRLDSFLFAAATGATFGADTFVGSLLSMKDPFLREVMPASTSAKAK